MKPISVSFKELAKRERLWRANVQLDIERGYTGAYSQGRADGIREALKGAGK